MLLQRSSTLIFVEALLNEAASLRNESVGDFQDIAGKDKAKIESNIAALFESDRMKYLNAAKELIPNKDWESILGYISSYIRAFGYQQTMSLGERPWNLMPWLASLAIHALRDL